MLPTRQGSFRLFRLFGIDVYLHWYWFLMAAYQVSTHDNRYSAISWNVAEYLALFVIVLTHEFGHALACRQVGGQANLIVLWPFGGVAYVSPPQRPGATLWSIAAGPLVNVVLVPILTGLVFLARSLGWPTDLHDAYVFLNMMWFINFALLAFNLLPIFPLDGGQILRSLLWYPFGKARSLMIAAIIGFAGMAAILALAVWQNSIWLIILALIVILPNCWRGFLQARELMRLAQSPRHAGFACPGCYAAPVQGSFWVCGHCRTAFDTFATQGVCPNCGAQFSATACLECGQLNPINEWRAASGVVPPKL